MNLEVPSTPRSEEADRVFQVALSLVPAAKAFGRKFQLDPDAAQDAMMKAAERVVKSLEFSDNKTIEGRIQNLPAYLFTAARHLMLAEFKRQKQEVSLDDPQNAPILLEANQADTLRVIYNRILLSEVVERMNPKARAIFALRTQGYSYHEIAEAFGERGTKTTAASLRSELSKAYAQITKELEKAGYYR